MIYTKLTKFEEAFMQFTWNEYKQQYEKLIKLNKQLRYAEKMFLDREISEDELLCVKQEKHNTEKFLRSCENTFWKKLEESSFKDAEKTEPKTLILDLHAEVLRFVLKKHFKEAYKDNVEGTYDTCFGSYLVTSDGECPTVELTFNGKVYRYNLVDGVNHFVNKIHPTFDLNKFNPAGYEKEYYKKLRTALWDGAKIQLDNFIKEKIDQKNRDVECYAMMINVIKSRQKELEQNKRMLAKKKAQAQSSIVVLEGVKDEQLNLDVDPSLRLVKKQK